MKKTFLISLFFCLIMNWTFAQKERKLSTFLSLQFNQTIYDRTLGNNPWGMGLGIQSFLNTHSKFNATLEITADTYLADDKVQRITPGGEPLEEIGGMVNILGGASFHPFKRTFFSLTVGPSLINNNCYFAIKTAVCYYTGKKKRCFVKLAYINVFNREQTTNDDFGSLSLGIVVKIF